MAMIIIGLFAVACVIWMCATRLKAHAIKVESSTNYPDIIYEAQDNYERFDLHSARTIPASGRYRINYKDQRGLETERDIKVKRAYENQGKYAIDAHCLLRDQHRSFINDRIQNAINLDTGEVIDDLTSDAIAQYSNSGEGRVLAAIDKEWMGVAILVFVCRADGQMRKPERLIVAEHLKRRCPDITLDDADLDSVIKTITEPDHREFQQAVRDLKKAGEHDQLKALHDCAKRIVATQKTITPMEKAALEILADAL